MALPLRGFNDPALTRLNNSIYPLHFVIEAAQQFETTSCPSSSTT
jgi:hypothetical protein